MREFLMMFVIDTKQSKSVSHEAVNSQTEPNSPRNEARHSPITDETPNTVWERLRKARMFDSDVKKWYCAEARSTATAVWLDFKFSLTSQWEKSEAGNF